MNQYILIKTDYSKHQVLYKSNDYKEIVNKLVKDINSQNKYELIHFNNNYAYMECPYDPENFLIYQIRNNKDWQK